MAPLGAAVWTGSGELAQGGIVGLVHAATGAAGRRGDGFDPTRDSIEQAVANAFALAAAHAHGALALPFLAGGIFAGRVRPPITPDQLSRHIARCCARHRGDLRAVLVAFGVSEHELLLAAVDEADDPGLGVVRGSITRASDHGCPVIVNAANLEVRFGGGVSGAIGDATGCREAIDREARAAVAAFWRANS